MKKYLESKKTILLISFSFAILVFLVLTLVVITKPSAEKRPSGSRVPIVICKDITLTDFTLYAKAYGTAKPSKTLTINAPYTGTVRLDGNYQKGSYIQKGAPLFKMETSKLSNTKDSLQLHLEELELQLRKLGLEEVKTEKELINSQNLRKLIDAEADKLSTQQKNAEALYLKAKRLHEQKALSEKAFLQEENRYKGAQLSYIQTKKAQEQNTIATERLSLKLDQLAINRDETNKLKTKTLLDINSLDTDINKSVIAPPATSQILELYVEEQEETTMGKPLAKLNLLGEVVIPVTLPDYYFKWLYSGPLLKNLAPKKNIIISIVNPHYKKTFKDGFIKSIAGALDPATRSLAILVGKNNPLNPNNTIETSEELLPGSYCEVKIPLDELKNVFIIPRSSIQKDGKIYVVDKDNQVYISSFDLLYEDQEGVIISLDGEEEEITIITHQVSNIENGTTIQRA